jgi:hypothetical protein
MPINYYCGINLNQTTLGKPVIDPLATPPDVGTEVAGQMYFDNAGAGAGAMYFWNGTAWRSMDATAATGVTSFSTTKAGNSSGFPLTALTGATGAITVNSFAYAGGSNIGHVPAGGGAGTFLRGDGVFATPAGGGTMSSWDVSGDSGSTETVADGNQVNFIGDTDGGILTKVDTSVTNQAVLFQLDVDDLAANSSPALGNSIAVSTGSGSTGKSTIAQILALAPQGDVTAVQADTTDEYKGINVTNSSGPIPLVGLDINGSTALAATANDADELMIYDDSNAENKKITVANLMAAAPQGDITAVVAGNGLTGGGTGPGSVTLNAGAGAGISIGANDIAVDYLGTDSVIKAAPTLSRSVATTDIILMADPTSGNVAETPLSTLPFTNNVGDITGVTAGTFMTGGGTSGTVTLNADGTTTATANKLIARDGSGFGYVITPSSGDSSTKLATTAFVQQAVTGLLEFKSGFNASTGIIADGTGDDLYTDRAIAVGDYYVVTVAGNFFGNASTPLTPGDSVIVQTAEAAGSAAEADFVVIQSDTDLATLSAVGLGNVNAGTGIGVVYSNGTATVTNSDLGSSQNIFKNVASDSGTAVADNNNDTLSIVGGSNVSTAVAGDVLTITATDTNTQYTAGVGLTLNGTVFDANVDGTNSVAANSSSTAAGRTYKVQVDSADKMVVNVPWSDSNTGLTSVGITETGNALTITNSPLTSNGNINIAGAGSSSQYIDGDLNLQTFPTIPQGDVTGVSASTSNDELGIKVASPSGPVPVVGLDIKGLTDIGTATASTDRLAVYDVTGDVNRYVQVTNLAPLIRKASTSATTITSFGTVTHSLNSFDVIVQLYNATTYETVEACVDRATVNTVAIAGSSFPAGNIRVLVSLCDQGA